MSAAKQKATSAQPPRSIPLGKQQTPTANRHNYYSPANNNPGPHANRDNNQHGFAARHGTGINNHHKNNMATTAPKATFEELEEEWEEADEAAAEEEREEEAAVEDLVEEVERAGIIGEDDEVAVAVPAPSRFTDEHLLQLLSTLKGLKDGQDLYHAQKKGGVTSRFFGDRHTVYRDVHIEFFGSLADFQNEPMMSLWQPPGASMWMDGKVGDPSSVLLHSFAVTRTTNPFPVQLGVDFDFLRVKGRHTNGGELRHLILHANEIGRDYNPPKYIIEPNEVTAGNFLQEHPNFHPDTVWEEGIM